MLFMHDKAKIIFPKTVEGELKITKAKIIALSTFQTAQNTNTHFMNLNNKMMAHFLLDGERVVKYAYNTTSVLPNNLNWNQKAQSVIDYESAAEPDEVLEHIKIAKRPLSNKKFEEIQVPNKVRVFYTQDTLETLYAYLNSADSTEAFHYIVDSQQCYEICDVNRKCNKFANVITVIISGKVEHDKGLSQCAKLIDQLMENNRIYNYDFINEIDDKHNHIFAPEDLNSIKTFVENYRGASMVSPNENAFYTVKDEVGPGDHIIHIVMLYRNDIHFVEVEKQLILFLAEYLFYFDMDTSSLYRLEDFLPNVSSLYYSRNIDFDKLINSVNQALQQLKNDEPQIEVISTGLPEYDQDGHVIVRPFSSDTRDINDVTAFYTTSQKSITQDYDNYTVGGNVELRSKFEDGLGSFTETIKMSYCYYEPVYPDLTVPPRNTTGFYNNGLMRPEDILKQMDQPHKPVIGKTPNAFDPYPYDDKIAQLEMHSPIVTIEYENASDVNTNMLAFLNNRFGNTEKRLVRIENLLATMMRYVGRLSSRVNVNCVYYGGTSVFGKYDGIRCMCDDLVNDAATRTIDQCLNCSRYEPVLGQFYEIVGDDPGLAQVYDDIQASMMTKEEFAKFSNITDHSDEHKRHTEDLAKLHIKKDTIKDYDDLLDEANNFVMNWTETPYHEQSPHINRYKYDPYDMYRNKQTYLTDVYEDGFKEQEQFKYERPVYAMNSLGGGNFNPYSSDAYGLNGLYHLQDYQLSADDLRYKIAKIAEEATNLGKKEKILYTLGAKILDEHMDKRPEELVTLVTNGTQVNTYAKGYMAHHNRDDASLKAVYFDCSSFVSYVYRHCGIIDYSFTTGDLANKPNFTVLKDPNLTLLEQLKKAYVGDIILYSGHAAIYAGGDEQWHASGDGGDNSRPNDQQVLRSKVSDRRDYVGIFRHNSLSQPALKQVDKVRVKTTLNAYIEMQKGKSTGIDLNNDGYIDTVQDGAFIHDETILRNYIDPTKRLTPELKMQFASIKALKNNNVVTAEVIDAYFAKEKGLAMKKVRGIKCDSNWDPVRDENGELVWEEKYQFPRGEIWVEAGKESGLNPLFLAVHCSGETGWCSTSDWTNYGGVFKSKDGRNHLFNAYGIWCKDSENHPGNRQLHRATARKNCEAEQWFTLEKSIIKGAKWIADNYIGADAVNNYGRRDTAYFMKWHFGNLIEGQNGKPCAMQYATDVSWADQRAKKLYKALENAPMGREEAIRQFEFSIPEFVSDTTQNIGNQEITNMDDLEYIGDFELTFYCMCSDCNGANNVGNCAHGHMLHPGITIAVDKSVIPFTSWVYIEGFGYRKACDVGKDIKGNRIDVCVSTEQEANNLGRKNNIKVYAAPKYQGDC